MYFFPCTFLKCTYCKAALKQYVCLPEENWPPTEPGFSKFFLSIQSPDGVLVPCPCCLAFGLLSLGSFNIQQYYWSELLWLYNFHVNTVKLLWYNLYCKKRYINKCELNCHCRCMSTVRHNLKKKNPEITMYDFLTIYLYDTATNKYLNTWEKSMLIFGTVTFVCNYRGQTFPVVAHTADGFWPIPPSLGQVSGLSLRNTEFELPAKILYWV